MPRLFVPDSAVSAGAVRIDGDAARHLAGSLRTRPGDTVSVVDASGTEYTVLVEAASAERVEGRVVASATAPGEPRLAVEVVQAIAKDGMDEAIDAMVQAGVAVVRPVITERTVARPDDERARRRVERWQATARETAQLAYRARIPAVAAVTTLDAALDALPAGTRLLACVIAPDAVALGDADLAGAERVALCIGPEGGFAPADLAVLRAHGAVAVHLGARVVRARLAGALAAALLLGAHGDLGVPQRARLDGENP